MTPEVMAEVVLRIDRELRPTQRLDGAIDSASFADTGFLGGGRANVMNKLGCKWTPSEKGPASRIAGKSSVHSRLAIRQRRRTGTNRVPWLHEPHQRASRARCTAALTPKTLTPTALTTLTMRCAIL